MGIDFSAQRNEKAGREESDDSNDNSLVSVQLGSDEDNSWLINDVKIR